MAQIKCTKSYRRLGLNVVDVFAAGVRDGVYGNVIFMTPPITQVDFQKLIDNYFNTRALYKQGGLAQKGPFLAAKTAMLNGLDVMAVYVDTIALGDANIITEAGYVPSKSTATKQPKPAQCTGVAATRPSPGVIISTCDKQEVALTYVCIVTTAALPADIFITAKGQVLFPGSDPKPAPMPGPMPAPAAPSEGAIIDFNANRKKEFAGLTVGTRYYFTYFAINSSGVGALSTTFSIICG